jgi:hypothetical protein
MFSPTVSIRESPRMLGGKGNENGRALQADRNERGIENGS